jgi:hypothetical protein
VVPAAGCYATGRFLFSGQNDTKISETGGNSYRYRWITIFSRPIVIQKLKAIEI